MDEFKTKDFNKGAKIGHNVQEIDPQMSNKMKKISDFEMRTQKIVFITAYTRLLNIMIFIQNVFLLSRNL